MKQEKRIELLIKQVEQDKEPFFNIISALLEYDYNVVISKDEVCYVIEFGFRNPDFGETIAWLDEDEYIESYNSEPNFEVEPAK